MSSFLSEWKVKEMSHLKRMRLFFLVYKHILSCLFRNVEQENAIHLEDKRVYTSIM